jgi:hypothetical protein
MISRVCSVGIAFLAVLAVASACPAAEKVTGLSPGRASVGGQFGGSYFFADGDYTAGALPRFAFAGSFRYVVNPWFRWQISPGFTWTGYRSGHPIPFTDVNRPSFTTKREFITLVAPVSTQAQILIARAPLYAHIGLGPGIYRVWIEDDRDPVKDPVTFRVHRGLYPGLTAQVGIEHFTKTLPSTSIEFDVAWNWIMAERDEQFPSGFNSSLATAEGRIGVNYYFNLGSTEQKKPDLPVRSQTKGK